MGWISRTDRQRISNSVHRRIRYRWFALSLCSVWMLTAGCDTPANSPVGVAPGADLPSAPARPPVTTNNSTPEDFAIAEEDAVDISPPELTEPEPVYRPADNRRVPEPELLSQLGIHVVESKHLRLYSDLPREQIESLPPLVDQLIAALEEYFGELPPDRDGKPFQLSGYIMEDVPLYEKSGLLPPKFANMEHGRHQGAEFWMIAPDAGYYLRHLLFHEATHCYMMYLPNTSAPVWYLEGMAECFGAHRLSENGTVEFKVFPESSSAYDGFGRIELIQLDVEEGGLKTISEVAYLESGGYHSTISYAYAWALCSFFDQHPRYHDTFRNLSRRYLLEEPFAERFDEEFSPQADELNQEWLSHLSELEYGMDFEELAIDFTPGKPLTSERILQVPARSSWFNSGCQLEAGKTYHITASGMFELDETTRPWTSTPDGISVDYYRGVPLGRLLGAIAPAEVTDPEQNFCFARFATFGKEITFRAPWTGTLYLRLNDHPDQLFDNKGEVEVRVEAVEP
ncbi:MAG: hypothetical protein CMJ46_09940 [Planctomyces sp.]|nr:hypothetical protein [Planctomyces sp.]